MSKVRTHISISLDGFVAGPNQSDENPLGEGGEGLHDWVVELKAWREGHGKDGGEENASTAIVEEEKANVGAEIMGRGMFGPPGGGPWGDDPWQGWWGEDPPFHMPVFVVTHHEREHLTLSDTTFTFVTDGIESALDQAREAAGGKDVFIGGGAQIINEYLAAGLVNELELHVVPILLGQGRHLFDHLAREPVELERTRMLEGEDGVAHLRYRVRR
jgi:dihydrofolate reductase